MSALDPFRDELRALLGSRVLLRRDRAMRAHIVCDAPRRLDDPDEARKRMERRGYTAETEETLWRIDLSPARREDFIAALRPGNPPADLRLRSLCRSLRAQGEVPPGSQPWPPIRQTLILLDAGQSDSLAEALSAQLAVIKRTHAPLPLAAAYLIEAAEGGDLC